MDSPVNPLPVGRAVRELRLARGVSLEQLAQRIGLHKGTVSELENGRQGYSGEVVARIAQALGVTELDIYQRAAGGSMPADPWPFHLVDAAKYWALGLEARAFVQAKLEASIEAAHAANAQNTRRHA